jgi:hypothetical protein
MRWIVVIAFPFNSAVNARETSYAEFRLKFEQLSRGTILPDFSSNFLTLQPLPECPKSRDIEHSSRAAREIPARQIRSRQRRRTFGRGFRGSIRAVILQ